MHSVLFDVTTNPSEHETQLLIPAKGDIVFGGHGVHSCDAVVDVNVPTGHRVHSVVPLPLEKNPVGHALQELCPSKGA
jgi:hypothetical protein